MSNALLKLAVASKDGISINQHFGHATLFNIYTIDKGQCLLLEQRQVEHYCHGNRGSKPAMAMILETIRDCHAVFIAKIGDGPADKLAVIGVHAISDYAYEAIEPSLLDYIHGTA